MLKSSLSLMLIGLLLNLTFYSSTNVQAQTKDDKRIERIKKMLSIVETTYDGKIEIKLLDKTKILGQLTDYDDDSLTVVQKDTYKNIKISFTQIKSVDGWISNKSFAKGILITIAVIGFLILYAKGIQHDP